MGTEQTFSSRLKGLLGTAFGAFVLVGCIAIIGSILVFDKLFPLDDRQQNEIAQSIAKIEKLPPGFERRMAAKLGNVLIVQYRNDPSNMEIKLSKTEGQTIDASGDKFLVETVKDVSAAPIEKKVVGDEDFFYKVEDNKVTSSSKLEGCVVTKAKKEAVRIESTYAGSPFKREEMDKFLQSIKSF